jgi:hypothetical protein
VPVGHDPCANPNTNGEHAARAPRSTYTYPDCRCSHLWIEGRVGRPTLPVSAGRRRGGKVKRPIGLRPCKRVGRTVRVCYSPCYNIRIKHLVLEHTGCSVCYNTRSKLLEHTSVVV